jgi:hypothetical protein
MVPSKTSPGAQNMKTRPDALGTVGNDSESAKHENGKRPLQYRRKRVRAQNMKTGPDALGTAENESGHAKKENGTRRAWHSRKRVWKHKTSKTGSNALGTVEN